MKSVSKYFACAVTNHSRVKPNMTSRVSFKRSIENVYDKGKMFRGITRGSNTPISAFGLLGVEIRCILTEYCLMLVMSLTHLLLFEIIDIRMLKG